MPGLFFIINISTVFYVRYMSRSTKNVSAITSTPVGATTHLLILPVFDKSLNWYIADICFASRGKMSTQ